LISASFLLHQSVRKPAISPAGIGGWIVGNPLF
jgi:hypothetical protein